MHRLLLVLFLWSTTIFFAACGGGNANNIGSKVTTTPYVQVDGKTTGGKSGSQVKSGGYSQQPDNGSIALNGRGLNAGPGFIQITRFMDAHLDKTGFRSFAGEIDTTTIVNVTWA